MIPLEEAQVAILAACERRPAAGVALAEALGCVLSGAVTATEDVPAFANTAMDGFAVRAADTRGAPVDLRVTATLAAGSVHRGTVGPGEAVRIMTGAPVPPGADAVVMVERTEARGPATVRILAQAAEGDHVRPPGDDLSVGQPVFGAGTVLGPAHLGVLASLGMAEVKVHPRLRVGVLSTGDELREGSGPLGPGQIRDSNRPLLLALLTREGAQAVDLGIAGDDEEAIASAISAGLAGCDALVTSGGVSVGDFDYVKAVLGRLGNEAMHSWQVAVKPAKPLAFGTVAGRPVFGLPGNPVSALVSFELFVRPALRALAGHADVHRPRWPATALDDFRRRPDGKVHMVRGVAGLGVDGRLQVRSAGAQGSHQLFGSAGANSLVVLPEGDGAPEGATVEVMVTGSL